MAHFAKVVDGTVTQVIVAEQEFIDSGIVGDPTDWIKTSYNTYGGVHYGPDGQPDDGIALRANFAGVGFSYDKDEDVFYASQPYPSWNLKKPEFIWESPTPYPTDGKYYEWNESALAWEKVSTSS